MMIPKSNNPKVIKELRRIAKKTDGFLQPEKVIKEAENPASPLHEYFCWDDTEAAKQYRLDQARALIRAVIRWVEIDGDRRPVNVFVSLRNERNSGLGYREMISVLCDEELRGQMLKDAFAEIERLKTKYGHLEELAAIFQTANQVRIDFIESWNVDVDRSRTSPDGGESQGAAKKSRRGEAQLATAGS